MVGGHGLISGFENGCRLFSLNILRQCRTCCNAPARRKLVLPRSQTLFLLVPKLRLGTAVRETLFRDLDERACRARNGVSRRNIPKRSLGTRRTRKTEFGNEEDKRK